MDSIFRTLDILKHGVIREIRKGQASFLSGLLVSILQMCLLVGAFFAMNQITGMSKGGIRGDLLVYLMTGVFLFSVHSRSVSAVLAADGPSAPMMVHHPMNGFISVMAAALAPLYVQTLSAAILLLAYHWIWAEVVLHDIFGLLAVYLLAWISGVAVGLAFLPIKPRFPELSSMLSQLYSRISMMGSGQMFVANSMPGFLIPWFDWNPLFHIIDQARGFAFINYSPWYSNLWYPSIATIVLAVVTILIEAHVRARVSLSWFARR